MRADEHPPGMRDDYAFDCAWENYTPADHAMWQTLYNRESKLLIGRACDEYLQSLFALGVTAEGIPDFRRMSCSGR